MQENIMETAKPLAEIIKEIMVSTNFGKGIEVIPVDSPEIISNLREANIGMDFRTRAQGEDIAPVFEGLSFDSDRLRSQAFALYASRETERIPVGVMTLIITPKKIVQQEKFLERVTGGVSIIDFSKLSQLVDGEPVIPEFVISPGWAKVADDYRGRFGLAGFRALKECLGKISEFAPSNSYIQIVAEGELPKEHREKIREFIGSHQSGKDIDISEFPEDLELFGQNCLGSNSTVKFAEVLGLKRVQNVADPISLGPVFLKKIK